MKKYLSQHQHWILIKSSEDITPCASTIIHRFDLEMNTYRMIPIQSIHSPVLAQKDTLVFNPLVEEKSCFIVHHPSQWSKYY